MLSDVNIAARLSDIAITALNQNFPFEPQTQIQPCSIDLRIGETVWVPKRWPWRRHIDLSNNTPAGPQISRAFRRQRIYPQGFLLRPGRFVLCSTYEKFKIPNDLCGRLIGRSSLGRLGLSVSGNANFINPGWSGRMPVVLYNHSPFEIRIHPYLSLVQLCLFKLDRATSKPYGSTELGSKYIDDDGGPSKYWLDQTVRKVRENLNLKNSSQRAEQFLEAYSSELDDPTRQRLSTHLAKFGFVDSPMDFINSFAAKEGKRQTALISIGILITVPISILISWLPSFLAGGFVGYGVSALLLLISLGLFGWFYWNQFGTTFSAADLRKIAKGLER